MRLSRTFPPCSLQHGQQLRGGVETHLATLGFNVQTAPCDSHLCCGSAGTYSVLQPEISTQLRDRKLKALAPVEAEVIVSGNIGCIQHLQSGSERRVVRDGRERRRAVEHRVRVHAAQHRRADEGSKLDGSAHCSRWPSPPP